ncbi:MAG: hypothetical protein F6K40_09500 [Okeania sp. SIO3I5]|uniref:hypothetical protein n=1 Tax=Okeania sp. SIO3I5 TaxID=2607805 RepID=UPI0013BDE0BC|nr:hypothetical protein [Okeania sp. SIO3I5]NEQ36498.1 hypothetical protein [Okeania sp. SIO3I5]
MGECHSPLRVVCNLVFGVSPEIKEAMEILLVFPENNDTIRKIPKIFMFRE